MINPINPDNQGIINKTNVGAVKSTENNLLPIKRYKVSPLEYVAVANPAFHMFEDKNPITYVLKEAPHLSKYQIKYWLNRDNILRRRRELYARKKQREKWAIKSKELATMLFDE